MATVHWLNHSGFALRTDRGDCLVVDPWFGGDAFNHAWSLLSPTLTSVEDLADCRHIWISHEHPDHFSPAALQAFPLEQRRQMTVWYHQTRDGRVLAFCKGLGFQVREMAPAAPVEMAPGLVARCGPIADDSWLHLSVDGATLMNLNDCEFPPRGELEAVRQTVGPVDVVLQQFSYANGFGNPDDREFRRHQAQDKLDRIRRSVEIFEPACVVPSASFVWFSHEENHYMNDEVVTIDRAVDHIESLGTRAVVLYPGDAWAVGAHHDNASALARYAADVERVATQPLTPPVPVTDDELLDAAAAAQRRLRKKNQLWLLKPLAHLTRFRPVVLCVPDSPTKVFTYDLFGGLRPSKDQTAPIDVELSADSLRFCLQNEFGMNTLLVNGRFVERTPDGVLQMRLQFALTMRNNHGETFPAAFVNPRYLREQARKVFRAKGKTPAS